MWVRDVEDLSPGKGGALFFLLCPIYLSGSPAGRGKAKRVSITGGWAGRLGVVSGEEEYFL